jgi:hypothetical protein
MASDLTALGVSMMVVAGCATTLLAQSPLSGDGARMLSQVAPPPPGPVPPNASRVTATVLKYSIWPPASLQNLMPPVPSDQTLYSLLLEIHASDPEHADLESMARPGAAIEAFSSEVLPSDLMGKKIHATVKLTGDTRGVRWWISNVRVVP